MKITLKNMIKWSIVISFVLIIITMLFKGITLSMQAYYYENNNDKETQEQLKAFANNFEDGVRDSTEEDRLIKEGKYIVSLGLGMQCILISQLLVVMAVGVIIGAGIGYVKSAENISKIYLKKMIVMYAIGVVLLQLVVGVYVGDPFDNDGMSLTIQSIFEASLPIVGIFTVAYIVTIVGKIIKNNKNKKYLNDLLKQSK